MSKSNLPDFVVKTELGASPTNPLQDIVRVLRLVEYEGPRDLVEEQLRLSLHGTREGIRRKGRTVRITAVTLDQFPQILEEARTQIATELGERKSSD